MTRSCKYNYVRKSIAVLLVLLMLFCFSPLSAATVYAADEDEAGSIASSEQMSEEQASESTEQGGGENVVQSESAGQKEPEAHETPEAPKTPEVPEITEAVAEVSDWQQDVTSVPYKGTYDGEEHALSFEGVPEGAVVEYLLEDGTWTSQAITRKDAGVTEVTYRISDAAGSAVEGTDTITIDAASVSSASLTTTTYVFNNKVRYPGVTVYGKNGLKLTAGTDYTVSYNGNCKAVGVHNVTISGTGNYTGTITKSFTIKPAEPTLKAWSLNDYTMKLTVKRTAGSYGGSYFQIAYRPAGGSWKYKNITSRSTTFRVPYAKTYYVKVRAVKVVGNTKYYGKWHGDYRVRNLASAKAQKVLRAAYSTRFAGHGYCAKWVCNVFDRSGVLTASRMGYARDYYYKYCKSSNKADLQPGMIVASKYSYYGGRAGHIGIYIGNGKVISNEGRITIKTLDQFSKQYGHGAPIKWGWMNNKKL